ncbi:MAG TPA: hypothetical protein VFK11_00980 [Candidatus Saccharimonadales bacterium]|nr:hypothetical protein [Candidatus Saccharimonadales bacterium]
MTEPDGVTRIYERGFDRTSRKWGVQERYPVHYRDSVFLDGPAAKQVLDRKDLSLKTVVYDRANLGYVISAADDASMVNDEIKINGVHEMSNNRRLAEQAEQKLGRSGLTLIIE